MRRKLAAIERSRCRAQGSAQPTPARIDVTVHEGTDVVAVAPDGRTLPSTQAPDVSTVPHRITDIFNDARQPAFSPDGKWIAFIP
jgi:hypothetical protein